MEVKINREIRDYSESVFFGLTLRQCVCSACAIGTAVALYFALRNVLGTEAASWACMIGSAPFAALGFVKYHGMPFEQFAWVWFRSEILEPKEIRFIPTNLLYELLTENRKKGGRKQHDENHFYDPEKG